MTKEALKLALKALERSVATCFDQRSHDEVMGRPEHFVNKAIDAIKKALAQPEQKYHRGDRLICLETEEYCVIHISGTDRQWVKFPDSHIGVYTNEQVAELFELLPKEPEQDQDEVDIRSRLYQRIHELETQLAQPENQGKIQTVDSSTERKAD